MLLENQVGVKKLNETNAMVEGLKGDLTKLEPILEQASKAAEKLLKQVEIDKADAAKVKEKVSVRMAGCPQRYEAKIAAKIDQAIVIQDFAARGVSRLYKTTKHRHNKGGRHNVYGIQRALGNAQKRMYIKIVAEI